MSDDFRSPRLSVMDRIRNLWWVWTVCGVMVGGTVTTFYRFTVYYLSEQSSIAALQSLNDNSKLVIGRLDSIDRRFAKMDSDLTEQHYTNIDAAQFRKDAADHLHALDGRADADRDKLSELDREQAKQNQAIGFVLDYLKLPHLLQAVRK